MIEKKQSSKFLYFTAIAVNLIAFTGGTALAWTSPSLPRLHGQVDPKHNPISRPITSSEASLIASLLAVGAIISPFMAATINDKYGRKNGLLASAIPIYISYIIIAYAYQPWHLCIARFLAGIAIGMFFVIVPNYIGEVAQKHNRGALSSLLAVNLVFGILFIFSIGPYMVIKHAAMVCLIAPTIYIISVLLWVPESPYFLVARKLDAEAEIALRKLRDGAQVQDELAEIKSSVQNAFSSKAEVRDLIRNRVLKRGITLTFGLVLFQQFSGINAILFFLQSIFVASGSELPPEICAIIIGVVQFLAALVVPFLVDHFGRRFLLLVSGAGTALSLVAIGAFFYILEHNMSTKSISWLPICSLIVFIIAYSMAFGPVPFTILGEIFPPNFRGLASMLTISLLFLFTFITTVFFPSLMLLIGIGQSFWLFAGFCVASLFFTYFLLPETKGKSLIEIQMIMSK